MMHEAGIECCVAHIGPSRELLPQCVVCKHCGRYLRPEQMGGACDPSVMPEGLTRHSATITAYGLPKEEHHGWNHVRRAQDETA